MYRIFCESLPNYIKQNSGDHYRIRIIKPLLLIADVNKYNEEKENQTELYKQTCDLLHFMQNNIEAFPRFKAFLWTIESRNMLPHYFGIMNDEDLTELAKIVNMMLKLVYWTN